MGYAHLLERRFIQVRRNPGRALRVMHGLVWGLILKSVFRVTNPNVKIGRQFRAYGRLRIRGPGRVIIGDRACVTKGFLRTPCILTHTPDSEVVLGDGCNLSGTRISSISSVVVGRDAVLASTTIADSLMIPAPDQEIDRQWQQRYVRKVRIGRHFWAGANSFVAGGAEVGDECVLGAGAVLLGGKEYPPCSLLMGNPARRIGEAR
ncbi:MAG: DapH/DapD/GlmU-related protein [Desulfobacteraceae bacterium]|nr:DapH/DapD/GlmU-related protein [Desulfobacteraceae bacterium]